MTSPVLSRGVKSTATAALAVLAFALAPASLQAKVITVPSHAFPTIEAGVAAAAAGDTVIVLPGTYVYATASDWPGAVGYLKSGTKLKAAGPVKLVGPGYGIGIGIWTDNTHVEGFDISGFGRGIVAGELLAEGTTTRITRNTIRDCPGVGIELRGSCNYEIDRNTLIGGDSIAILLQPMPTENAQYHLHHNRVSGAKGQGIMVASAPGTLLDHNICENNVWEGIYLAGSPNCVAEHNRTDNNGWAGIEVGDSPGCVVTENEANDNVRWGIYVWGTCGTTFELNKAAGNGLWDLFAADWDPGFPPTCNTYLMNQAGSASPSLALWDVN